MMSAMQEQVQAVYKMPATDLEGSIIDFSRLGLFYHTLSGDDRACLDASQKGVWR
jgi:hypothetical protein